MNTLENGSLYLNKKQVDALQEAVSYIYEIASSDNEEIAKQGLQIAAIVEFLLKTEVSNS